MKNHPRCRAAIAERRLLPATYDATGLFPRPLRVGEPWDGRFCVSVDDPTFARLLTPNMRSAMRLLLSEGAFDSVLVPLRENVA